MKTPLPASLISVIGITLILLAVLSRRLSIRNLNNDSLLSFIAGLAILIICFLLFSIVLKKKR